MMTKPQTAADRILVALDFDNADAAIALVRRLAGTLDGFKVGLELVNAAGLDIFARLTDAGAARIFYDAKFHDIPNTVAGAVRAASKRGVWMLNVHASGGSAMLRAARDAADSTGTPPLLIGVTVLTSMDEATLNKDMRVPGTVAAQVAHLTCLSQSEGMDGIVTSPLEIKTVRDTCGPDLLTVIPGIRPAGTAANDQARIASPASAVAAGADYIVIGRAITAATDPVRATQAVIEELEKPVSP